MTEPQGLGRLKANGYLVDIFKRDARTIVVLKCATCDAIFERDVHGSGLSSRIQDRAYCKRECARKGNHNNIGNSGDSQLMRFRNYKERMV